jgi:hypothetical protein
MSDQRPWFANRNKAQNLMQRNESAGRYTTAQSGHAAAMTVL